MKTSLAPTCVYSPKDNQVIGCSIEGMILEILKQIEVGNSFNKIKLSNEYY